MIRRKARAKEMVIDLTGPAGNAFALLGTAADLGRQLGWTKDELDTLQEFMTAGDYEELVRVFDHYFGDFVVLLR